MSTWTGVIVETLGRADFWDVAARHGVEAVDASRAVASRVLLDCGGDYEPPFVLAEALSRELGSSCIAFAIQTSADVHVAHEYRRGERVRALEYNRDEGGWTLVEGDPQPWERAYFFDDVPTSGADDGAWPDMLFDEMPDADIARFDAARTKGDASGILDLLHPSSTMPMARVCEHFGIPVDPPGGRWKKPLAAEKGSFWKRLLGR